MDAFYAALTGGIVSAVIAILGFVITVHSSTKANNKIADITRDSKSRELKHLSRLKLAEFRMDWIDGFRRDSSALYRVQYEISRIYRKKPTERTAPEKVRLVELYYRSAQLKSRLLMRLKPDSNDEHEKQLEKILRKAVKTDQDEAKDIRVELRDLTRQILKTEWNRVKTEVEKEVS